MNEQQDKSLENLGVAPKTAPLVTPVAVAPSAPSSPDQGASLANAPARKSRRNLLPLLLAPALLAGEMPDMGGSRGSHRGENRKARNYDNSRDRAPGMKPFDVDGVIVYAGTLKAAQKKARLMKYAPLPEPRAEVVTEKAPEVRHEVRHKRATTPTRAKFIARNLKRIAEKRAAKAKK